MNYFFKSYFGVHHFSFFFFILFFNVSCRTHLVENHLSSILFLIPYNFLQLPFSKSTYYYYYYINPCDKIKFLLSTMIHFTHLPFTLLYIYFLKRYFKIINCCQKLIIIPYNNNSSISSFSKNLRNIKYSYFSGLLITCSLSIYNLCKNISLLLPQHFKNVHSVPFDENLMMKKTSRIKTTAFANVNTAPDMNMSMYCLLGRNSLL